MNGRVYAVANLKGGVGKTTLAMNMAAGLARRSTCIVVDADPQGSATQWKMMSDETLTSAVQVVSATDDLHAELSRLRNNFEYVIVDCPPDIKSNYVKIAMENAQLLLIPVLPSPMDLWASARIEQMVDRVREHNPGIQAYLVLNQIEPRNAMSRGMDEALKEFSVPALSNRLTRRASYRTSALEGSSVYDIGYRGQVAADEVEAIINEVLKL